MMAALQIKNIPTGAGDDIKIDATWAKGDTKNVIATIADFAELRDVRRHQPPVPTRASASARRRTRSMLPAFAGGDGSLHLTKPSVSAVRSTTTGIRTGRRACSAAIRRSAMTTLAKA